MTEKTFKELFEKHIAFKKNVCGFSNTLKNKIVDGKETDELSLRIYVSRKLSLSLLDSKDVIPKSVGHYKTDVVEVGVMRALQDPKKWYRPAPAGVSAIYDGGTACTLGWFALDEEDGEIVIIANNHCTCKENMLKKGHPYVQPSPIDGTPEKLGKLKRFVPIVFDSYDCKYRQFFMKTINPFKKTTYNKVDLGIESADQHDLSFQILKIGTVAGKRIGELGELLHKMGRTTEYTRNGKLIDNEYYGQVQHSRGIAPFGPCGLIEKRGFCAGGDSSSAVLFMSDNFIAGLLFAGSDTHALFCHWNLIEEEGNVRMLPVE